MYECMKCILMIKKVHLWSSRKVQGFKSLDCHCTQALLLPACSCPWARYLSLNYLVDLSDTNKRKDVLYQKVVNFYLLFFHIG